MIETHQTAIDRATDSTTFDAWVDGSPYRSASGERIETVDPAVNLVITTVPDCDDRDVNEVVGTAWDAYRSEWAETTPKERALALYRWSETLRDHLEELTTLECLDTGKPITHARGEVEGAIETLEYYASIGGGQEGIQLPATADLHAYTKKEPYGVVGQITPWNFPIWAAAWKLGPALAAGNAVVLKPSIMSPLTTVRMAQLSQEFFPDGVINVLTGQGSKVGKALVAHDNVRKLSFTGSGSVGAGVMKSAADHIAPVTLELGGKSPFIVFPDADLSKVATAVSEGIFYSTGEICDAFARVLVHEDVKDEFVERFLTEAQSWTIGDPLEESTTMGPLTTEDQFEKVCQYVSIGREEGGELLTGGTPPSGPEYDDGWYFQPTVFDNVTNDMRIAQDEIFGPVQTVLTFTDYDDAIAMANDTKFGLAAGIGTESTTRAHRAADDLEAGIVYINGYGPILPQGPYGGFKASGIGRDLGKQALDHYQQTKTVYVNLDSP